MEACGGFGLHLPTFVGLGEDETAENPDGRPGNYVMRIMLVCFDTAVGHKRCRGIAWDSQLPSVTLADELGAAE